MKYLQVNDDNYEQLRKLIRRNFCERMVSRMVSRMECWLYWKLEKQLSDKFNSKFYMLYRKIS